MSPEPAPFPDDQPVIRVSGLPTADDWKHALRLYRSGMNTLRRKLALLYVYCVVGAGLIFCWLNDIRFVCYLFAVLYGSFLLGWRIYSHMVTRESLEKRERIEGEDLWIFSLARVRKQAGPNHSTFEWRYLDSIIVADDMLVLLPTTHACYCVPLRLFANKDEMETVVRWAAAAGVPRLDVRKGTP
ncbi:hypothetical protein KBB96_01305 [Luteolibacter ambystomatis]|uniref:YcxB family protein n=1 Tax=Luteolibacter ambystomatis TaxID=2824561 RepID=A0A975G8Y5_9BACT|nr:hypothetical protein [Luteolibacter ambystomatis]QUE51544.1 hypothetical protein KBB96_01305 [Luteolibacter ambystomatis]